MSAERRTVMVGEGLRPGRSMDDAIEAVLAGVASLDSADLSIAVLDRSGAPAALAVTWFEIEKGQRDSLGRLLAAALGDAFDRVRSVQKSGEDVARRGRLT